MDRLIRRDRRRRSNGRDVANTRSAYVPAQGSRWETGLLWASLTLFTACLIGIALSLRVAGALAGLIVSPVAAAEFSEVFVGLPSVQLSQGQGQSGPDELAAAMLVPNVNTGPIAALAAADGSNVGPSNAPSMQLAIAAFSGGISTMINYPFGFWCSDNFRVLAGADASNLNRLCTGSVPTGGRVVVRGNVESGDEPPSPPPPLGPCESLEVLSMQTARLSFSDTRVQTSGSQDNALPSGSFNGPSGGGFTFMTVSVQQSSGSNANQQAGNTVGGAFGSRSF